MLKQIRSFSSGIGTKILLLIIIISFAIWGVGDMVRQSGHNATLATVGSEKISQAEFARSLQQQTEQLKQALGSNFSPQMLQRVNLPSHVLQRLINQRLLDQESAALGLIPSDTDVVHSIRTNAAYLDDKGNFDRKHFDMMLHAQGVSEKTFIEETRQDIASNFILDTIVKVPALPDQAAKLLLAASQQQRTVALYTLSPALAGAPPAPTTDEQQAYYKAHIAEFTAPELRTVSYVSLSAADAKKTEHVSSEDLQKAYQERIDEFKKPERRTIDQLLFASEDAAKKAYDAIKGGKPFEQVAKDSNILNAKTISLGTLEQNHAPEIAADKIFALEKGGVTEPVKSGFGWHIFRVKDIIPPATQPLEEVRESLEKELLQNVNENALSKLSNSLEDTIAGGATLKEAANELNLKLVSLAPMDKGGRLENGTPAKDIPPYEKFLDTAFKTDEKTESGLITAKGGVAYIVRVESITPEHAHPLEEVKSKVIAGAQREWQLQKLAAIAKQVSDAFATDEQRAATIAKFHLSPPQTITVKRKDEESAKKLASYVIDDVFAQGIGGATKAMPIADGTFVIAVVKAIIPGSSAGNEGKLAAIHKEAAANLENEVTTQYLRYLAGKYPVSVNEATLQSMSHDE